MSLPANFAGQPGEELHRIFRNTCIEFKKLIKSSKNIQELEQEMLKFIGECKAMDWHTNSTGVYHKDEGKKLAEKILAEFKRYKNDLEPLLNKADPTNLLNALDAMEQYVKNYKVT